MSRRSMRLGRFFLSQRLLVEADRTGVRKIFEGLVILDADPRFDRDGVEYLAEAEHFDEIPAGMQAPEYEVSIDPVDGQVNWERAS